MPLVSLSPITAGDGRVPGFFKMCSKHTHCRIVSLITKLTKNTGSTTPYGVRVGSISLRYFPLLTCGFPSHPSICTFIFGTLILHAHFLLLSSGSDLRLGAVLVWCSKSDLKGVKWLVCLSFFVSCLNTQNVSKMFIV